MVVAIEVSATPAKRRRRARPMIWTGNVDGRARLEFCLSGT